MNARAGALPLAAYLEQSRRSKPASDHFVAVYTDFYKAIEAQLSPRVPIPHLSVIYSSERRCEFVRIAGTGYILYDQYLGQSFNALNRILLASHSHIILSRSYACKYLSERLLTLGCYSLAQFFGICYQKLVQDANAKGNPYYQDAKLDAARVLLSSVQEIFVLAHEVAHHLLHSDEKIHLDEVGTKVKEFVEGGASESGELFALGEYYQNVLKRHEAASLPELFADDSGGRMAMQIAADRHNIPIAAGSLGIRLAFRYLRLFRHLELLARKLVPLETVSNSDVFSSKLKSIDENVWDEEEGQIAFFQLREHFLLHRLRQWQSGRAPDKVDIAELLKRDPLELIDQYDDLIEGPVLMTLVDSLKEHFRFEAIADLRANVANRRMAIKTVDRLTGWSMTTDLGKLRRTRRQSARGRERAFNTRS